MAVLAATGLVVAFRKRRSTNIATFFIATQANESGQGIWSAHLDPATGTITADGVSAEVARPTWLLCDPERSRLYAVSELGNAGDRHGEVLSFAVAGRSLTELSRTSSGGGGATHLACDRDGGTLFVANFGGGPVTAIPIAPDGTLAAVCSSQPTHGSGPHRRQTGPHPHGVTLAPDKRFLLVPDMGADRVFVFGCDDNTKSLSGSSAEVVLPAGSGPRLMAFGRSGRHAYLLSELSAELFVYRWDGRRGHLDLIHSVPLDDATITDGRSAAMLVMSSDGRFLYTSNRRTNTIEVFAVHRQSGRLSKIQSIAAGGEKPWGGALAPDGHWLVVANQGSGNVTLFAVDRRGSLSPSGSPIAVPAPTGIEFLDAQSD